MKKNNTKDNYSGKNSNNSKKRSNSKNYPKTSNFYQETDIAKTNTNFYRNGSRNTSKFTQKKSKDKKNDNYIHSRRINYLNNSKSNIFSDHTENKIVDLPNKRNFDDWIWGKHSVYSALTSNSSINRIWCTSEVFSSEKFFILLKDFKSKGVLIEEVSWNRLSQLTYGASHQGIVIQLAHSKTILLNELINIAKTNSSNPIILALDGITDPHNLGAIIRSAEAFGCKGIVLPQRRSVGLTGTVAKVAAGALEHLPVSRVVNLNRSLEQLKSNGFVIVGLSGEGKSSISTFEEKMPLVLIIGAEDKGISLLTQKKCDFLLKIPLKGKTPSLNASVAAAISLFHLTKYKKYLNISFFFVFNIFVSIYLYKSTIFIEILHQNCIEFNKNYWL